MLSYNVAINPEINNLEPKPNNSLKDDLLKMNIILIGFKNHNKIPLSNSTNKEFITKDQTPKPKYAKIIENTPPIRTAGNIV